MNKKRIVSIFITLSLLLSLSFTVMANEQNLSIEIEHVILDRQGDNILQVMDMISLKNNSREDIESTSENPIIRIRVPDQAIHLEVSMQGADVEFEIVDGEVVVFHNIPAERSMEFALNYLILMDESPIDFTIIREYPVKAFNVYVSNNTGLILNSTQFVNAGAMSIEQRTYNTYTINNIAAGQPIQVFLERGQQNNPALADTRINQGYDGFHNPGHIRFWENSPFSGIEPHLFTFVFVSIIAFAIGHYFYRWHVDAKRIKEQQQSQEDDIFIRLYKEEAVLKKKLAELQLKLDDNEIDEDEYNKRREIYKKKLINVKLKIKEFTE